MIINKEFLEKYFKQSIDMVELADRMNRIGIICKHKNGLLFVEYPTIRPDCNALLGVLIEIGSCMDKSIIAMDYEEEEQSGKSRDSKGLTFIAGTLKKDTILDMLQNAKSLLEYNKLCGENTVESFKNMCALCFGIVPVLFEDYREYSDFIDKIQKNKIEDANRLILNWQLDREKYLNINIESNQQLYIIVPVLDAVLAKKYIDTTYGRKVSLYYYYIRQSNLAFAKVFSKKLIKSITYINLKSLCLNRKNYDLIALIDNVNLILNEEYKLVDVDKKLKLLGYRIIGDKIYTPSWRTDICNAQDVANDIFRFSVQDLITEKEDESNSDYTTYVKKRLLEERFVSAGFRQIMSRPFVGENESRYMEKIECQEVEAIRLLNPMSQEKPYFKISNYFNCKKAYEKYGKVFEDSIVKWKKHGNFYEEDRLGFYFELGNQEMFPVFVGEIWNIYTNKNIQIKVKKMDGYIIWIAEKNSNFLMKVLIDDSKRNKVSIFGEFNIRQFIDIEETDIYDLEASEGSLVRTYSFDLPMSCSPKKLINIISECTSYRFDIVVRSMSLYIKQGLKYLNYRMDIRFYGIKKSELAILNEKIVSGIGGIQDEMTGLSKTTYQKTNTTIGSGN